MGNKFYWIFTLLLACLIFPVGAHSQEDMQFVNDDAFTKPRRPAAVFRHNVHNELAGIEDCHVCHHVYDENGKLVEDESSEDQRCSECHELERSGNKPALMKAFHTNCKGCHKQQKNGPLMCGQCHIRGLRAEE